VGVPARNSRRLVGREAELAKLDTFLAAEVRTARALVLAGGPGVGKTSLWETGITSAQRSGILVLTARPSEAEIQLSFAALSDLLESVDGIAFAALPAPQRHALEVALLRSEPSDRPPEARAIAAGFLGVLRELAVRAQLLIAIDDMQWLDAASAGALRFAQRRLNDLDVAFLVTERTGAGIVRLDSEGSERLEVGGISLGATRLLLSDRLDFHPPRALLRRIFESAGGNPLFTLELARTVKESGEQVTPEQPLPVPNELGALLGQRLAKLAEPSKTAALGAALTSDPSTALIEALLGEDARTSLGQLVDAGVIEIQGERIRFTHPLMASTVIALALPGQRRAMQRTLAGLVEDPVTSARHLALASSHRDGNVARALEDAALLARARGGWDTAAELLERARDLTPSEDMDARSRRAMAAAEYHAHAGDRSRARDLLEEILQDSLPRSDRANALRLLAEISRDDENFAGAISIYEEALRYVDDPAPEVGIELGLAYVCASSWRLADAVDHAYRALEIAEACNDDALTSAALAACAMVDWQFGRGVAWDVLERALALEDQDALIPLPGRTSTVAALLCAYTGRHAEARARFTAVWKRAADQGEQGDIAFVLTWFSWLETRTGNFETAAAFADEAGVMAAATGSESARAHALAQRAYVHAHEGDVIRARELSAAAAAAGERVDFHHARLWRCATLALLELSLGNAEAAWASSEDFTAPVEAQGVGEPVLVFFLPDAIEALVAIGRLEQAEGLASSLERRGRELDGAWAIATGARCRGLLLAARADFTGSEQALADALTEHERLDMPFERARTLFAKGVVERRAKQRARARASLAEALAEFERLGARLWVERAREELTRVSGRRPRPSGVMTATEEQVAGLAVQGLSNKEIADTLFVSVHTVESHLSHVYQKLGVRSRSQLASKVDGAR
jgi:DNA-binding CsgD family transcriptional regulator